MKKFTVSILAAVLSLSVAGLSFAAEAAPAPIDPGAPAVKAEKPAKKHHTRKHTKKASKKAASKAAKPAVETAPAAPAAK